LLVDTGKVIFKRFEILDRISTALPSRLRSAEIGENYRIIEWKHKSCITNSLSPTDEADRPISNSE
jgi:hypothetical protein